jgi:Zn-dependent protease with chaperone function
MNSNSKAVSAETSTILGFFYDGISAIPRRVILTLDGLNVVLKESVSTDTVEPIAPVEPTDNSNNILETLRPFEYIQAIQTVNFGFATQHGVRLITFAEGAQFQAGDTAQLNAYLKLFNVASSWVDTAISKWRWVALCGVGVIAIVAVLYQWGIPLGATVAAPYVPKLVKDTLGDTALSSLDDYVFEPSKLKENTQDGILKRWNTALALAYPKKDYPEHKIIFRSMPSGNIDTPNAMALPNGTIVVTDGLVKLLDDKPDAITGVLAHELGHLEHHHSMRSFIEFSSLGAISAVLLGDYTVWVNQIPLFMGQMSYSRDHEGEADDAAIKTMRAAKINPAELAVFFERVESLSIKKAQETKEIKEIKAVKAESPLPKSNQEVSKEVPPEQCKTSAPDTGKDTEDESLFTKELKNI